MASIAFIRMMIPVEYRIRPDGVMNYAYGNANPVETLKFIGQQAATEYMASTSFMNIMSVGRAAAQAALLKRIQTLADEHSLGVEITNVMILDSHPPVEKVAPAFQDVIGAMEAKESLILQAKSFRARTIPEASAQALQIVSAAQAYSYRTTTVARAEADRFGTQLATYLQMPRMFRLKAYLDFLENDCKDIRKYIVAVGLSNEVYELNFQTKERLDLVDVDSGLLSGN
ncbi:Modulator of FtsH protease HflK [bioreactor metagenome]|uniref:Modulator of FtsH protease HflK n=1 Tax=bioreactor metagenome TaxID=1076179 RepID=A0A645FGT2_9ZZZZ